MIIIILYGVFKCKRNILDEIKESLSIDGIQLVLVRDVISDSKENTFRKDTELFLDFSEQDCVDSKMFRRFRLKSASIMIDGEPSELIGNSELVYHLVRNSRVDEVVVCDSYSNCVKDLSLIGSIEFVIAKKEIHLKTKKTRIY